MAAPLESRGDLISAEGLQVPQPGPGSLALAAWLDVPTHWRDGNRKGSNLIPVPPYASASGPQFLETAPQGQPQASRASLEGTVKR